MLLILIATLASTAIMLELFHRALRRSDLEEG